MTQAPERIWTTGNAAHGSWNKDKLSDKVATVQIEFVRADIARNPHSAPDLSDPIVVHANMLRGSIAKPTIEQIIHIYGVDALCAALAPKIVREAEDQAAHVRVVTVEQLEYWVEAWRNTSMAEADCIAEIRAIIGDSK